MTFANFRAGFVTSTANPSLINHLDSIKWVWFDPGIPSSPLKVCTLNARATA
jgi:hypothetical protein